MKKLTRKLVLSIAALAVCAATLVSSTFAWYTTNTEVEATEIAGATAASGDASVLIKGNASGALWKQTLVASDISITGNDLAPVAYNNPADGEAPAGWVNKLNVAEVSPSKLTFSLYFKTAATTADVKLKITAITVTNETADADSATDGVQLPTYDNLLDGSGYTADVLDSLVLRIAGVSTEADTALSGSNAHSTTNPAGYSLAPNSGIVTKGNSDTHVAATYISGKTAHTYVNGIMGEGSVTKTTTNVAALTDGDVYFFLPASGKYTKVDFEIYLDGANEKCFDAVKGQSFKINMQFNVAQ